jgi:phage terminase small subunit
MEKKNEIYPGPAAHLTQSSKRLWLELGPSRARSLGRQIKFQQALEMRDLTNEIRKAREAEGIIIVSKRSGLKHINPIVRIEKDCRKLFARLWSDLGLDWDVEVDSRVQFHKG